MTELAISQQMTIAAALIDSALKDNDPVHRSQVEDCLRAIGYDASADAVAALSHSVKA